MGAEFFVDYLNDTARAAETAYRHLLQTGDARTRNRTLVALYNLSHKLDFTRNFTVRQAPVKFSLRDQYKLRAAVQIASDRIYAELTGNNVVLGQLPNDDRLEFLATIPSAVLAAALSETYIVVPAGQYEKIFNIGEPLSIESNAVMVDGRQAVGMRIYQGEGWFQCYKTDKEAATRSGPVTISLVKIDLTQPKIVNLLMGHEARGDAKETLVRIVPTDFPEHQLPYPKFIDAKLPAVEVIKTASLMLKKGNTCVINLTNCTPIDQSIVFPFIIDAWGILKARGAPMGITRHIVEQAHLLSAGLKIASD